MLKVLLWLLTAFTILLAMQANLEVEMASPIQTGVASALIQTSHLPGLPTLMRCNWTTLLLKGFPLIAHNCQLHSHG